MNLSGGSIESYLRRAEKTITFTGAAGLGAQGAVPIFTVTGQVIVVALAPFCTVNLVGASATLSLGVTGATTLFIASTTAADIDADEFWIDATPDASGIALPAATKDIAIATNIIGTVGTADITAGAIRFVCYWMPLSSNGNVA